MKTQQLFLAMAVIGLMVFSACQDDTLVDLTASPDIKTDVSTREAQELSIFSTVDLRVQKKIVQHRVLLDLSGEGSGASELFGNTSVRAELQYYPDRQFVTGEIELYFEESASRLLLQVRGAGTTKLDEYNAEAFNLRTTVLEASGEFESAELYAMTYLFDAASIVRPTSSNITVNLWTIGKLIL